MAIGLGMDVVLFTLMAIFDSMRFWQQCLVVVLLSTNGAQRVYLRFKKYIDRVAGSVLGTLDLKLAVDRV